MSTKIRLMGWAIFRHHSGGELAIASAVAVGLAMATLATAAAQTAKAASSVGAIATVSGTVLVKPSNSSQYYPANVGTRLYVGDLIWPAAGSEVILECSNGAKLPVPSGVPSGVTNICPLPQCEETGK